MQKININQENPFDLPEIQESFTKLFSSVYAYRRLFFIHGKYGSQSTHDCIPNGVENRCHNLFLCVVALPTKIKSIFHHTQVRMLLQAVRHATAVRNPTFPFDTNWQFFHLFIHLFDIHCSVIFASLRNSFSFRCFVNCFSLRSFGIFVRMCGM